MRTRAERRHNNVVKALRKRNIVRTVYSSFVDSEWYDNLHQYSKNKIHCSCPICSAKTGKRKNRIIGEGGKNWSISDERRIEEMEEQIMED